MCRWESITGPATDLGQLAEYVESERQSGARRPTFATVHGRHATQVRSTDLTLDKFIDASTLAQAPALPRATGMPRFVPLTRSSVA